MKKLMVAMLGIVLAFAPAYADVSDETKLVYSFVREPHSRQLAPEFADRMTPGKTMQGVLSEIMEGLPPGTAVAVATRTADGNLHFMVQVASLQNNIGGGVMLYFQKSAAGFHVYHLYDQHEKAMALGVATMDATHGVNAIVPNRLLAGGITLEAQVVLLQPLQDALENLAKQ